jgi:hypothetical protein
MVSPGFLGLGVLLAGDFAADVAGAVAFALAAGFLVFCIDGMRPSYRRAALACHLGNAARGRAHLL